MARWRMVLLLASGICAALSACRTTRGTVNAHSERESVSDGPNYKEHSRAQQVRSVYDSFSM